MTASALALALALLVAPGPPRHRLLAAGTPRRLAIPTTPCLIAGVLLLAVVAPIGLAVAAAIVAFTLDIGRRRRRARRAAADEAAALQSALDVLAGELRIGAHPVVAFDTAAGEVGGVVAASMRTVSARARMGADVVAGLRGAALSSAMPAHWERLAGCWQLADSHGLAIATLMRTAQRDIVARQRFSSQVAAGMAGARTTAAVLAGLPLLGIGLGELVGAEPVRFLLSDGMGQWLLVAGAALSCAGLAWSDRITGQVVK
ncbi:tight adherence protein B [Mycolicibacterium rutilum]|uniref:Tight adherence protein B n=1 Tax=Mycolicibacterium rutilum TaxID=370526 RepID=A0A1H6JME3_MYCRU|nr:type II secretion system F family protein [Mycolicibacterium rutilum]SEH60457.1 tight adherence protein B [Mycolicibacterium rutilum]